jgi:hypothetical protein
VECQISGDLGYFEGKMTTLQLVKIGELFYPIILTQEKGEISEAKACELLGMRIEDYRDLKYRIVKSVLDLLDSLPSPLTSLLEGMKEKQN